MQSVRTGEGPLSRAGLGEVVVYVRDIDRMRAFYIGVLGLAVERDLGQLVAVRGIDGSSIVLHSGRDSEVTGEKSCLLQFLVRDIQSAVTELQARGVAAGEVEQRPYGRYARFLDPEGNRLGLEQMT
jgi:predicted enzyme related to lactoylglutathione lyase